MVTWPFFHFKFEITKDTRRNIMTTTKKETVENKTAVSEEAQQEEVQQETTSDYKILYAPLAKYGVIAILMVSIIVTTAIMMDREFNDIDSQVTALETEIALQNQAEQLSEQASTESVATSEEPVTETPDAFARAINTKPVATAPEIIQPVATAPVKTTPVESESVPVTTVTQAPQEIFDPKTRIAERNEFMAQQDQKQLDVFKANQEKQIEMLRAQLVKQQERIDAMEKRNLETYEMRKAAIQRMQEARQQSMNRI
jgi:hypothetical protein